MKVEQKMWTKQNGWSSVSQANSLQKAQLVFVFGNREILKQSEQMGEIKSFYPESTIIGCSTAGEIIGEQIYDNSLVATAILFEHTKLKFSKVTLETMEDSVKAGEKLANDLTSDGLEHVFVLSDGLKVNGSALTKGLCKKLPENVAVTGGLAGDQAAFKETLVFLNAKPEKNTIVGVGFYGNRLKIGYGSMGGWTSFGVDRLVTKCKGNVLYELDGQPALDLYKKYLGTQASGLPATGLLFPLSIRLENGKNHLVRTILGINESNGSMTFAGDIPEGSYVRLMKANFEQLVDGAAEAAKISSDIIGNVPPDVAILISCVGRKLILKQRVEEEIEMIREIFGDTTALTGFYSYGEICPIDKNSKQSELHNQTMTITSFTEN